MEGTTEERSALDLRFLESQTFGDRALERELLRLFAGQCRRLLPVLAGDGDAATRADAAHLLKGAASAIGAFHVAALAGELESLLVARGAGKGASAVTGDLAGAIEAAERAIARDLRDAA